MSWNPDGLLGAGLGATQWIAAPLQEARCGRAQALPVLAVHAGIAFR